MNKRQGVTIKHILILVIILILPGFLYYLLTVEGKNRYKPLPFYGPKQVAHTGHKFHGKYIPDTIYHVLPQFKLVNQRGNPVNSKAFNQKITVVNFFYTHCASNCIRACDYMDSLAQNYRKNDLLQFVSITVDPEHDRPTDLSQFAKQYHADKLKWLFLTGDSAQVYNLARNGFLVNASKTGSDSFNFSNQMILIDAEKRIRGYYTAGSVTEVMRLNDEIKVQIAEELRKIKAPEM